MNRDDIQKLMGGYATGTLTPEEQQALFEAALDDQELFDALAREQTLRDLLRDPGAKADLLAALDHRPSRWYERLTQGWRPLAGAVAMAGMVTLAVVVVRQSTRSTQPALVAQVSPPPADAPPAPTPLATVNPATPTPIAQDNNAAAMKDRETSSGRLAKESRAKVPAGPARVLDEDRRDKAKQVAQALERNELADSVREAPSGSKGNAPPLPAAAPMPPPAVVSGFRQGAVAGGLGDNFGGTRRAQQPIAEPKADAPLFRSATGNTVGGVSGGIVGGVPSAAPPAPATVTPPKAEAQPSQSAQGQQGQQGASSQSPSPPVGQVQGTPSQLDPVRLAQQQRATAESVEVTAAASLDTRSTPDVKSLFYGGAADASLNAPGARGGGGGFGGYLSTQPTPPAQARKKATDQQEKAEAIAVNAIAATGRAQAHLLNLGVRYSLMRKTVAGGFEQVDPDNVKTGDTIELQLMPNYGGSLSVKGRSGDGPWHEVMSSSVEARKTYSTPPLKSGDTELQVMLTRPPVALTGVSLRDDKSGTNVYQQATTEPATYVVTGPASPRLLFTITLNYK